jgi:hypothetical protein
LHLTKEQLGMDLKRGATEAVEEYSLENGSNHDEHH